MIPELHPACAAFPAMPEEDLQALADDIRQNGLREPVTLMPDGRLLDGRCRWQACELAGVTPTTVTYDGTDPVGFVLSKNHHRRHLTKSQRALALGRIANQRHGSNRYQRTNVEFVLDKLYPEKTYSMEDLAKQSGIAPATVQNGRTIIMQAEPHIIAMVENGAVAVRIAAEAVRKTPRAVQATWTQTDVEQAGRAVISAYPSAARSHNKQAKKAPKQPAPYFDVPYKPIKFPTPEEMGAPPEGSSIPEYDAFFTKYGRTPLHPKTVADALMLQAVVNEAVARIVGICSDVQPDADAFFNNIEQLLDWHRKPDKTNGEETDFAGKTRKTLAMLEGLDLQRGIALLTAVLERLPSYRRARVL